MDWRECKDKKMVRTSLKPNKSLIKSLIEMSESKIEYAKQTEVTEDNAPVAVSIYYDSLREVLEAIAELKGYKIYNHECFCAFLKDILERDKESELFDRLRKIRNQINYYGKKLSKEEGEATIKEILSLRNGLIKLYLEDIS